MCFRPKVMLNASGSIVDPQIVISRERITSTHCALCMTDGGDHVRGRGLEIVYVWGCLDSVSNAEM
jgi:hypothetical protein